MKISLQTPLQLGPTLLPNRAIMTPLTRGRAAESRIPNDLMKTYYTQRTTAGLIITEATAISEDGYGWVGAPALYNMDQLKGWR